MFRLWDRTTFCIFSNTSLPLENPTRLRIVLSSSLLYPPNTSITMLNCFTWYPGNCLFNSSRTGAYFSVFSQLLVSLLFSQGQLISSKVTDVAVLSTIRASTLLALTVTWSAYTGTSQKACAWSLWFTGFGSLGEYHGGTLSTRSRLCSISKKIIFDTALYRCRYLDCASAEHPANMCATVSAALPHNRHMIWSGPVLVFFLWYTRVGSNCSYSSYTCPR